MFLRYPVSQTMMTYVKWWHPHPPLSRSLPDLVGQSELPWAIEAGSIIEDFGRDSDPGTPLRGLYEGSLPFTGLCPSNAGRIKAGEFAETCLLLEVYAILSDDFRYTAK